MQPVNARELSVNYSVNFYFLPQSEEFANKFSDNLRLIIVNQRQNKDT